MQRHCTMLLNLHRLIATLKGFGSFTNHNGLVFILKPLYSLFNLFLSTVRKVLQRAVRPIACKYMCFRLCRDNDVWTNIIKRWSLPHQPALWRLISVLPTFFSANDKFECLNAKETASVHAGTTFI